LRNSRLIGRIIALAVVVVAVAAVVTVLVGSGGGSHTYKAMFQNASQLVSGDLVQVAGAPIGSIKSIGLSPDGQAQVTMSLSGRFAKLREGTQVIIRQASLSGIANRYIDLNLPPTSNAALPDGATIDASHTVSAVDLDEIFNIFGPKQRQALSGLIQGLGTQYAGESHNANLGYLYLNPALASSSRLFSELNRDPGLLTRFVTANARFVTDVAARQNDLAGLVDHLATTTTAIGTQKTALEDAIHQLPIFMRQANTTFVNLRGTLDNLTPLVNESKPVAKKLRPFLAELKPLTQDARPTIHDLAILVKNPTKANADLISLTKSSVPVRNQAIGPVTANGAQRPGAFPAGIQALQGTTPELAFARPYAPDLTGWFSGFSVPGLTDALGNSSRTAAYVNIFATINGQLSIIPPALRAQTFAAQVALHQNDRCPGGAARVQFNAPPGFECKPGQEAPGP